MAQPQGPPIEALERPHIFYSCDSAVVLPTLVNIDYELNPALIDLAEKRPFYGLQDENPMDHLARLESVCGTRIIPGIPEDYNKCKIFEFSLSGKAKEWYRSLLPNSLEGWIPLRNTFIDHFYTKAKTNTLRERIANFSQDSGEPFSAAWARFKHFQRECPHHGFTDIQLLRIFYEGVSWKSQTTLNTASEGNFMNRSVMDATNLIENLAESCVDSDQKIIQHKGLRSIETDNFEAITSIPQEEICYVSSKSSDQGNSSEEVKIGEEDRTTCSELVVRMKEILDKVSLDLESGNLRYEERFASIDKQIDNLQDRMETMEEITNDHSQVLGLNYEIVQAVTLRSGRKLISHEKQPLKPSRVTGHDASRLLVDETDNAEGRNSEHTSHDHATNTPRSCESQQNSGQNPRGPHDRVEQDPQSWEST